VSHHAQAPTIKNDEAVAGAKRIDDPAFFISLDDATN
jgi:hypothetical protein